MTTDDHTLMSLQQATIDSPDDMELKEAFRQMIVNWSYLEDCWMESPDWCISRALMYLSRLP